VVGAGMGWDGVNMILDGYRESGNRAIDNI
jgi:hypothetical protein